MSFACCHSSFTVLTPSKVRPAMWLFSSKLPIHSVRFFVCLFFIYYNSYYFCLRPRKSHPQSSWVQWASFRAQIAYRLKTELSLYSRSDPSWEVNPTVPKAMNIEVGRFPLNRVKCFIFGCSNPSLVIKVWRAKPKYSHLVFLVSLASITQIPPARKWNVYEDNESIITQR